MAIIPPCGSIRLSILRPDTFNTATYSAVPWQTLIDIHLTRDSAQKTGVTVLYERTALIPEANEHVQHFAKGDEKAGKEWEDAINGYFAKLRGNPAPK